ncbi:MAG: hypothetical protein AVDCRST_MAG64-681 [uncultured Phycisphaerae bacterium]|uniref:PilZ domain-containing protein n=1 Tax=uncultured Phycisphaerae bacterium TaxID=904963 RepID=A0A6J4N9F2_9BACT|nr:MAG: hypothetical protein AVDCRST_MAG64-681 [uncultured Phycisphaerae bacterium]
MSHDAAFQLLRDAIARNVAVDLRIPADAAGEPRRGRLLAETNEGVLVEPPGGQAAAVEAVRRSGGLARVTFRRGEHDVQFDAAVLRREPAYLLGPAATVEAVVLRWPAEVRVTQRRNGYRVKLPHDAGVVARAWHVPEGAGLDHVPTTRELAVEVRDLSVCGMGLILPAARARAAGTRPGERLRVELVWADRRIATIVRVQQQPLSLPDGSLRLGLDFDGMDRTLQGRRALAQVEQLVAALQRTEVRRSRAGGSGYGVVG